MAVVSKDMATSATYFSQIERRTRRSDLGVDAAAL